MSLICECGWSEKLGLEYRVKCPRCSRALRVEAERSWRPAGRGLSRYSSMLALTPLLTLGEGSTPLLERSMLSARVLLKLEHLNPTGSFKDRGAALAIGYASSLGYRSVVEDTSGNTGIAVAAYSTALGLEATIVMPSDAPAGKKALCRALGAEVIEASSREEAYRKALELWRKGSCYLSHLWSPLFIEGYRTIAYEVYEEAGIPDLVVCPVGSAGLLLGLYAGFRDLVEAGVADKMPKLIAVQGASVAPLYELLYGRRPQGESKLADGIRVPSPPRLSEAAQAIRETDGLAITVTDQEISSALRRLLKMGLIVEPTSAAAIAALAKLPRAELQDKRILTPLTGSGLKQLL